MRQRLHGTLTIHGNRLRYSHGDFEVWALPAEDIVLVAEHTTDHGPFAPDYFYVFAGSGGGSLYEAPLDANPTILTDLSDLLRVDLMAGLVNRIDFASRVIWPPELAGQPLFEYRPSPRGSLWGLIADRFAPLISSRVTPNVQAFLGSSSAA